MIQWVEPQGITWLGQTPASAFVKVEKKELDTQEKILIVSVFLGVLSLAWQVYEFRKK